MLDTAAILHAYNGTTIDRLLSVGGALKVSADTDGVYVLSTNPTPDTMGGIVHIRGATPDKTSLTFRNTGATSNADNVTPANVQSLDVNSFVMGYNTTAGTWSRAQSFGGKLGAALFDEAGNPYTTTNPIPVAFTDAEGTEVNNFNTSASLASLASSNHDYTVSASVTLKLSQILASASGKLKITLQTETGVATSVFNTVAVMFSSTSSPNLILPINENIAVISGARVRIIRTSLELQAMDVYSLISGHEQ